ncbi:MAG: hypothetical protein ACPL0D_04345 [Thermosulfidibacteraceae bacterium]
MDVRIIDIYVDGEGNWYYRGIPSTREDIIRIFIENLVELPDGSYGIKEGGKVHRIKVEDTPMFATSVDFIKDDKGIKEILVNIKYLNCCKSIDPKSIVVTRKGAYVKLRDSGLKAKLSRSAYMQLANIIEEESGKFYITVSGKRYYISSSEST